MIFSNYIKIKGLDNLSSDNIDPAQFEIFQGLGSDAFLQVTNPSTALAEETTIAAALWEGQNKLIAAESTYALNLETLFKQQQVAMPKSPTLANDVVNEVGEALEEWLSDFFGGLVIGVTGAVGTGLEWPVFWVAKFAAEVGISFCWDKLKLLFTKGVDLCQAIKAENDAMLTLEVSLENYTLRKDNLRIHTEMLENVITQIATMEEMLERNIVKATDTKSLVKAIKPISGELEDIADDTDNLKKMKEAIEEIQAEHEKLRDAVEALQYNDEVVEFGDAKLHLRGKVLET